MKAQDAIPWILLGVAGYVLYQIANKLKTGTDKVVNWTANQIAQLWISRLPPPIELLGNVKFPGNILVPLNQIKNDVRQDDEGHVFVKYSGLFWQLSPSDANGNWPATRVP
jgi:hypothetical protein